MVVVDAARGIAFDFVGRVECHVTAIDVVQYSIADVTVKSVGSVHRALETLSKALRECYRYRGTFKLLQPAHVEMCVVIIGR